MSDETLRATLSPIKLSNDARVAHEYAICNGRKYHYVNGVPQKPQKGVALLLHGFPDFWYGWHYIIPSLLDIGLRVIVPDCLGYGETDKPRCPPNDLSVYGHKSQSADLVALLGQLNISGAIVIGHDWGAVLAQRLALYHPSFVTHIACIAIPYTSPMTSYAPLEELVKRFPNFTYQVSLADPSKFENHVTSRSEIERVIRAVYLTRGPNDANNGKPGINNSVNLLELLGDRERSWLLTEEDLKAHVDTLEKGTFHGPCNYYRIHHLTHLDEKDLGNAKLLMPALFIKATYDPVIPAFMTKGQEKWVPNLTHREVATGHWAMLQDPVGVIGHLKEWFEGVVFAGKAKL